jgi:hypothetical protein
MYAALEHVGCATPEVSAPVPGKLFYLRPVFAQKIFSGNLRQQL